MVYHSIKAREDYERYKDSIQELRWLDGHLVDKKDNKIEAISIEAPFSPAREGLEHHIEIILKALKEGADAYCGNPDPRDNAVQLYKIKKD